MQGLGDNVYQRVVARACLAQGWEVWARTSWPQVWWDLPVKILPTETQLRTQAANLKSYADGWDERPESPYERRHLRYSTTDFAKGMSIPSALLENAGFTNGPVDFSFRPKPEWLDWAKEYKKSQCRKPLAIVHPGTVRTEWPNSARPNDPRYMQQLIDQHQEFEWWELGWLDEPHEVLYGDALKGVTRSLMRGQFTTEQLIALMAVADVIVTCVGFMLPLGIALRTPTLCLYGGDLPDRSLVEPWMIGGPYAAIEPTPFCTCGFSNRHTNGQCNKVLEQVDAAFSKIACPRLLTWDGEYGHYPVFLDGQYDESYFNNYARLKCTGMGQEITHFRVAITDKYFKFKEYVDVGPGACHFVEASGAYGFDINPTTNARLKQLGRYVDPKVMDDFEVLTFWDSLEHLEMSEIDDLLRRTTVGCVVSMPIYNDREHVLRSRHFKPREHMHYWTDSGFVRFMTEKGFRLLEKNDTETALGREGVRTYVFSR
jgi:hypothetical protein